MPGTPRVLLLAALGCVAAFVAVMAAAYYWPFAHSGDLAALAGFESLQRPLVNSAGDSFLRICDPIPFASVALVLIAVVARLRTLRRAFAVWVLLAGANLSSQLAKPLLAHARDAAGSGVHAVPPAAFPSGHATAAMSLALALVIATPRTYRPIVAALGGGFALVIVFLTFILGWHYPSDALGGFLLATIWALIVLAALRWAQTRWPEPGSVRLAARRAIALPPIRIALRAAAGALLVALAIAASRAGSLAGFADRHHAVVFVTAAITLSAVALVGGVTLLSGRQR